MGDKPTVKATGEIEKQEEDIASEFVMDVFVVEEDNEASKEPELKAGESVEFQPKNLPFLAVLRNTMADSGIVFSVWLCLVIPSAAPKQRIRALVIKTEKPSAALAKAKEAEAASKACEAAGVDPRTVV